MGRSGQPTDFLLPRLPINLSDAHAKPPPNRSEQLRKRAFVGQRGMRYNGNYGAKYVKASGKSYHRNNA